MSLRGGRSCSCPTKQSPHLICTLRPGDCFVAHRPGGSVPGTYAPRNDIMLKRKLPSHTETREFPRYHSGSHAGRGHSMDDRGRPVRITENNAGLLTCTAPIYNWHSRLPQNKDQDLIQVRHSYFSLRLREDFRSVRLTCSHHLLQESLATDTDLLVPITAIRLGIMPHFKFTVNKSGNATHSRFAGRLHRGSEIMVRIANPIYLKDNPLHANITATD